MNTRFEIINGKCEIPAGSEDLYRQHPFFKKFKNVVV